MLSRDAMGEMERWKIGGDGSVLVLRGARRVGKSTLAREFGRGFGTFIPLNMEKPADREYLQGMPDPATILQRICLDRRITPRGETLLFLDEAQALPGIQEALARLREGLPQVRIAASCSFFDSETFAGAEGFITWLDVLPLSFREFLMALGESQALTLLGQVPLPGWAFPTLSRLLKTYALVGGMPEAVSAFARSYDVPRLSETYRGMLSSYSDGQAMLSCGRGGRELMRRMTGAVPAESGKRITFENFAGMGYRSRESGDAVRLLEKSMLVTLLRPTASLVPPLAADMRRRPRLHFLDMGLTNWACGTQGAFLSEPPLDRIQGTAPALRLATQEMLCAGLLPKDGGAFWVREDPRSLAETDFIIKSGESAIPICVTPRKTGTLRSIHSFIDLSGQRTAVRLWDGMYTVESLSTLRGNPFTLISVPLFHTARILDYVALGAQG